MAITRGGGGYVRGLQPAVGWPPAAVAKRTAGLPKNAAGARDHLRRRVKASVTRGKRQETSTRGPFEVRGLGRAVWGGIGSRAAWGAIGEVTIPLRPLCDASMRSQRGATKADAGRRAEHRGHACGTLEWTCAARLHGPPDCPLPNGQGGGTGNRGRRAACPGGIPPRPKRLSPSDLRKWPKARKTNCVRTSLGHSEYANFVGFGTFRHFLQVLLPCANMSSPGGGGGYVYTFEICKKTPFQKCMGWGGGPIFQRSTTHWTVHTNMALHRSSIFTLNHCHRQHFQAGLGPH